MVEEAKVLSIDDNMIRYQIKGSVDVTLHYADRSDPTEIYDSFPYECTTAAPASDPRRPNRGLEWILRSGGLAIVTEGLQNGLNPFFAYN